MEIMADLLSRTTSESQRAAIATLAFGKGAAALGQAFSGTSLEDARRELERFGQATDEQLRKLADAHETIETFWRAFKQNAAIATSKGITAIQNFNAEVTGLGGLINDFLADPNVRTFYDLLFGKGAADAAGLVKQSDAIKDNNDALIAYQDELRKTEAQIAALRAEIARLKEEDPTINVTGIESAIMQLQVRQAELNTLIQETVGLYADLSGMRAQAESYVNWQIRRAQGYTAIPGAPPQPAYSPTALPQVTVPPKKVEADVEIEIDDDDAEKAAKKLTDKFSGNLSDAVTNAIGAWETRGMSAAEAYMAIGGAGEIGRYQIMQANIGPWSREALGYSVTPAAFRASPDIQDQVARFKVQQYMDQYYAKYGIEGVARAWNTGSPTGRATAGYVEGVMGMLESGAGFQDLQEGINDTTDAMAGMIDRMAELRSASEDFLNTFVDGILDGKSAVEALGDALEELGRSLIKSGIHQLVGAIFPTPLGGASLLQHGGPMYPGNVYRVHKDEVVVPRSPMSVIPASKVGGGGGGGYSLNYAPSIVIQGNADEAAIRMMRDRMLIDIEQRLPSMVRGAHRDRRL
jgi:hypothetical protein